MFHDTLKLARIVSLQLTEDSVTDLNRAIVEAIDEATDNKKLMTEKFNYDISNGIFHYKIPRKVLVKALRECHLDDEIAVHIQEALGL